LAPWEGNVTRSDGVATSVRGEATPGRENGADDANWADTNLTGLRNEENAHD
jgi:hypothetical protein